MPLMHHIVFTIPQGWARDANKEAFLARKRQVYHLPIKGVFPASQTRPEGNAWIDPKDVAVVRNHG